MKEYKCTLSKFRWRGEQMVRASIIPTDKEVSCPINCMKVWQGRQTLYEALREVYTSASAYGIKPSQIDNTQATEYFSKGVI